MREPVRACPREDEALVAIVTGTSAPELDGHVAECADCREVRAVAIWLRGVARETELSVLPGAERIWWRAQVERRLETRHRLAERAARPIRWFERGAAAAAAVTVTAILWTKGMATASAALARLSDPTSLGALTAALMALAGLAARESVRRQ